MATLHPYLQRRGGRWFFRISVPVDLRPQVGAREICRALGTGDRRTAVPLALELGAAAATLFCHLRDPMTTPPNDAMLATLRLAKSEARRMLEGEEAEERLEAEQQRAKNQLAHMRREHEHELAKLKLETERDAAIVLAKSLATGLHDELAAERAASKLAAAETLKSLTDLLAKASDARQPHAESQGQEAHARTQTEAGALEAADTPLHELIDEFLAIYASGKKLAMAKKIRPAMSLLRELHGHKPHAALKQRDIEDFFEVVSGLPSRWTAKCRALRISARELAAQEHESLLNAKTWEDNYREPLKLFLTWARANRHDEGFPPGLNVDTVEFQGDDDSGRRKQRALRLGELERLFHGPELQACKADPERAHMWWLPVLAFYTGARVNELMQLNPLVDIRCDPSTEIDYIEISAKTPGDPRIVKSVKTGDQRLVPLHPDLIGGGFLDYVSGVREGGHRLLFPAWAPINRRASTQAEKWFRDLLRETGLRDETPGQCVLGMHTFRHTLLTLATNSSPSVDAGPITGHADQAKGGSQRGYEVRHLATNKALLVSINFGFKP
jgi:hypothetical protein